MRTFSRTSAIISAVAVTAGLAMTAATSARAASVTDLYVNNSVTALCSDTGTGTWEKPYCTIGAAAAAAQPGQTVHVEGGGYPAFTIGTSGTPDAPITFQADGAMVAGGTGAATAPGITISNAHDVRLEDFNVTSGSRPEPAILIQDATDITVDSGSAVGGTFQQSGSQTWGLPAINVTGVTSHVTISRMAITGKDSGVELGLGVGDAVISTNFIDAQGSSVNPQDGADVRVNGAVGTVVTSNTILMGCQTGIDDSTPGTVLENNILQTNGVATTGACNAAAATGISVPADDTSGTVADYNLIDPRIGSLYNWAGTGYSDLGAFTTATGQGAHDLAANPGLTSVRGNEYSWFVPTANSPAVDSADANAPGELDTDMLGLPHTDLSNVPNTGTGPGDYDRGAVEEQTGFVGVSGSSPTVTTTGPLSVTASIANGPFLLGGWPADQQQPGLWTFNFGDGSAPVVTTAKTVTHTYRRAGDYTVNIFESYADFQEFLPSSSTHLTAVVGAHYTPVAPVRVLDTRSAVGVSSKTPVPAGGTLSLPLPSVAGVAAPDISAVVLNVAVLTPAKAGWLGVYPGGQSPGTANVAFAAGEAIENLVTVQLHDSTIDFHNGSSGTVHVVADLQGYYAAAGDGFAPQQPSRVLDTRNGTGVPAGALGAGKVLKLSLAGKVPAGTDAVALNVTALGPAKNGYLTVYPDSPSRPVVSNVAFASGQTVADMTIVPLTNGVADVYNGSGGTVNVVADLTGTFSSTAPDVFVPYGPARVYDSRTATRLPAGGTRQVPKQTYSGCTPACPVDGAVVYNVTATQPTGSGYLTVYAGGTRPVASTVAFTPGDTVSGLVTTVSGPTTATSVYNGSDGTVQVIADEQGYYIHS